MYEWMTKERKNEYKEGRKEGKMETKKKSFNWKIVRIGKEKRIKNNVTFKIDLDNEKDIHTMMCV